MDVRTLDLPPLATRAEVASYTQISIPTLARWAQRGEGPKLTRLGRAARYRRQDVLDWLDSLAG